MPNEETEQGMKGIPDNGCNLCQVRILASGS